MPSVGGPVSSTPIRRPMQGGKQPRRRPPGGGGDRGGGKGGRPSNRDDTPSSRRSGVSLDQRDLQDALDQMSEREHEQLRKRNVQSVTPPSTITTVYIDGRLPSVSRTSMRVSLAPNQSSLK